MIARKKLATDSWSEMPYNAESVSFALIRGAAAALDSADDSFARSVCPNLDANFTAEWNAHKPLCVYYLELF